MWASDPYPGSTHDVAAPGASGLLEEMDPSGWIGDKGYIGRGMITPHKKPPNGELSETAKEENRSVNRIRRAERARHRPHQVLENPPHPLPPTPGNIRADHHRSTRTLFLQDHPLNNLPGTLLVRKAQYRFPEIQSDTRRITFMVLSAHSMHRSIRR